MTVHIPAGHYAPVAEIAALLDAKPRVVRNWIDTGYLDAIMIGGRLIVEVGQLDDFERPQMGRPPQVKK